MSGASSPRRTVAATQERAARGKNDRLHLDCEHVSRTAHRLVRRIRERFGECKLLTLAEHVTRLVDSSSTRLDRGTWRGRVVKVALIPPSFLVVAATGWGVHRLDLNYNVDSASDVFQGFDAASQIILMLLGIVVVALSLGTRVTRRDHLKAVSELRAMAHVIDMHQLDKDPDRLLRTRGDNTDESPGLGNVSSPFLLSRYLDYCGEMLALVSKVAAFYAERVNDPEVLSAINDVEDLCSNYRLNIGIKMTSIMALVSQPQSPVTDE